MEPLLVGAVVLVVAVVAAWLHHRWTRQRIAAMSGLAASKGWAYHRHDPFGLPGRWHDTPFGEGYARRAEHVLDGEIRGRPFVAFDYSYKEDSSDSDGKRRTTTYRFGVCVLRMPATLPALTVGPESLLSRLGQLLGVSDIELESEDFNRRYKVRCGHPKFASDVLHPRTMELLLRCDPPVQFRFDGADVVCWRSGRNDPADVVIRGEVLARVVDAVPAFVWKDHGGALSHPA